MSGLGGLFRSLFRSSNNNSRNSSNSTTSTSSSASDSPPRSQDAAAEDNIANPLLYEKAEQRPNKLDVNMQGGHKKDTPPSLRRRHVSSPSQGGGVQEK